VEHERPIHVELPRCPFCHENVKAEEPKHGCPDCMAWHHEGCWSESGAKCAACGRGQTLPVVAVGASEPTAQRDEDLPAISNEKKLFFTLLAVALIALSAFVGDAISASGGGMIGLIAAVTLLVMAGVYGKIQILHEKSARERRRAPEKE
jgi:hypothetical protein